MKQFWILFLANFIYYNFNISLAVAECPNDSIQFEKDCYFFKFEAVNFYKAEQICASLFGHLISIYDGWKITSFLLETGKCLNFDAKNSNVTNFWLCNNRIMAPHEWICTDGTPVDYVRWIPGGPENSNFQCSTFTFIDDYNNQYWTESECNEAKPYICKASLAAFEPLPIYPSTDICSGGYVYFQPTHSCYGRGDSDPTLDYNTWAKAEKYCEQQGGHLPSLHSDEETKFVASFGVPNAEAVWSGLYSVDELVSWKWSDGTPTDYLPWLYGNDFPFNNDNIHATCVYVNPFWHPTGSLINDFCSTENLFICQIPLKDS